MAYWAHSNPEPAPRPVYERRRKRVRKRDREQAVALSPCVNPRCRNLDDDGNIEPVATRWCDDCRKRIGQDLVELAQLYVDLYTELTPVSSMTQKTTGTKDPPLPLNTEYTTLMQDIVIEITSIADRIRAARTGRILKPSETPGRTQREGRSLSRSIDLLSSHLHWALEKHEDGIDTGQRILTLNHRVRSVLRFTRYVKQFNLPCPDCGVMAVVQIDSTVQCNSCGATWPHEHIKALEQILAHELEAEGA